MIAASPRMERMRVDAPAVLALGSNLGDREATLDGAVEALGAVPGIRVEAMSRWLETTAVTLGGEDPDAPRYLNGVVLIRTTLSPHALLDAVHEIENRYGRVREERWGNRTLDIDIVDYDERELNEEALTLPHPRAAERRFVLVPWLEIDPDAVIAGRGRVADLLELGAGEGQ